jgi:hypothetical protein
LLVVGVIRRVDGENGHLRQPAGILRARLRPRQAGQARQRQPELAASHSITSSARSRIEGGIVIPSSWARFHIDGEDDLGKLVDREIPRVGAFEDPVDVARRDGAGRGEIGRIGEERAMLHPCPSVHDEGETFARGEIDHE